MVKRQNIVHEMEHTFRGDSKSLWLCGEMLDIRKALLVGCDLGGHLLSFTVSCTEQVAIFDSKSRF